MTTDRTQFMPSEEYRLSFGTGGLYVTESAHLIQTYFDLGDWSEVIEDAVEKNLLQFKSTQSTRRAVREICTRLKNMTPTVTASPITAPSSVNATVRVKPTQDTKPSEEHVVVSENQKGISFDKLFGNHLRGATEIKLTDPYLQVFHQMRNLMEFIETVVKFKAPEDDVTVHILTSPDDMRMEQQVQYLEQVQLNAEAAGVRVTWEFDGTGTIHARHIITNTGWKILLDRGLDIFQRFEMNDAFNLANRIQEQRACKAFEVTYVRASKS